MTIDLILFCIVPALIAVCAFAAGWIVGRRCNYALLYELRKNSYLVKKFMENLERERMGP